MNRFRNKTGLLLAISAMAMLLPACGGTSASSSASGSKKTHDAVTMKVTGKDTYEPHNFVNGKCTMCDETTDFIQDALKDSADKTMLTTACDQQGTVETLTYEYTPKNADTAITKTAYVYLPYGYNAEDASTKYDVLYMLHGKGLNEGYWLAQGSYKTTDGIYTGGFGTENVLDTLMKSGKAKKTICVTPTYYLDSEENQDDNFAEELTKVIMPLVASNYHTYAADNSDESLKANRDHQGYVGLSLGSMYSYSVIMAKCLDYFSYVGSFSGSSFGEESWNAVAQNLNDKATTAPLKYWYASVGSLEDSSVYPGDPFNAFRTVLSQVSYLKQGSHEDDNCMFMKTNKTGHNYASWITSLYNCMQVFFQK